MSRLLITTVKNEAPYLLEWVAYHLMIGFDRFLVYSNDCADGSDALLDVLAAQGWLCHERNTDYAKKGVQWTALERARTHPFTQDAAWVLCADIDEFVNIKVGDGTLDALFEALPQADAITLTWRLFGNSGLIEAEDNLVLRRFTQAAPFPIAAPLSASHFKTLYRNTGAYGKLGVHRPGTLLRDPQDLVWVNGAGQRLPPQFASDGIVTYGHMAGKKMVCLNHYSVKSATEFVVKSTRGLPNRSDKQIDLIYWLDRNFNSLKDLSIQRHLPALERDIEALTTPEMHKIIQRAKDWHRAKAAGVLNTLHGLNLLLQIAGTTRNDIDPQLAKTLIRKRYDLKKSEGNM